MLATLLLTALTVNAVHSGQSEWTDREWAWVSACPQLIVTRGEFGNATGVVIHHDPDQGLAYVLTAAHAVRGAREIELRFYTRESYPRPARTIPKVGILDTFPTPDFAVLAVPTGNVPVPVIPLAAPGQRPKRFPVEARSIGCMGMDPPTVHPESIRAKRLVQRGTDQVAFFWETERASVVGRSGGPMIDDQGRVIGLTSAAQDQRGYHVHLDEILAGLRQNGHQKLWGEPAKSR